MNPSRALKQRHDYRVSNQEVGLGADDFVLFMARFEHLALYGSIRMEMGLRVAGRKKAQFWELVDVDKR